MMIFWSIVLWKNSWKSVIQNWVWRILQVSLNIYKYVLNINKLIIQCKISRFWLTLETDGKHILGLFQCWQNKIRVKIETEISEYLIFCSTEVVKSRGRKKIDFYRWLCEFPANVCQPICPPGPLGRHRFADSSKGNLITDVFLDWF